MAKFQPGHALYFEFHDSAGTDNIAQFLVVGYNPTVNGEITPYGMYSRVISSDRPQTTWRPDFVQENSADVTTNKTGLVRMTPILSALELALESLSHISGTIDATANYAWDLYREPFVIHVGPLDIVDIANRATPKKLMDRVRKVRLAEGWPALPTGKPKGATV